MAKRKDYGVAAVSVRLTAYGLIGRGVLFRPGPMADIVCAVESALAELHPGAEVTVGWLPKYEDGGIADVECRGPEGKDAPRVLRATRQAVADAVSDAVDEIETYGLCGAAA